MRHDATTVGDLLARLEPGRRGDVEAVDRVIRGAAPELDRALYAGPTITMIGYGSMPWLSDSGSGTWPLIGMASQKQYISLYVAAQKDGQTLPQYYRERLGRTTNGKQCIRFRRVRDIDVAVLADAGPRHGGVGCRSRQQLQAGVRAPVAGN